MIHIDGYTISCFWLLGGIILFGSAILYAVIVVGKGKDDDE